MSKFYFELRDMWHCDKVELGTDIAATEMREMMIRHQSSSQFVCQARELRDAETLMHWTRVTQAVSDGRGTSEHNHDIFSVMQSDETRVWPPTRGRVMQTSWHPPTVSGGSQEASCKFIFMFLPQHRPAWPGYRSHACNVPRDPGLELRLMELLPGLEHSEFSAELH